MDYLSRQVSTIFGEPTPSELIVTPINLTLTLQQLLVLKYTWFAKRCRGRR
jgi:hypothetical protein